MIMATTNSTGMFSIDGICSSPQMMTVRKAMFSTVTVNTTFVDAETSSLRAVLAKMGNVKFILKKANYILLSLFIWNKSVNIGLTFPY